MDDFVDAVDERDGGVRHRTWSTWVLGTELRSPRRTPKDPADFNILVPTLDTTRYTFLLTSSLDNGKHVLLFVGETGTGKSVLVQKLLTMASMATDVARSINLLGADVGQPDAGHHRVEARQAAQERARRAARQAQTVIFVDDLNMPALEKYGAQPPIELLRQWIDTSGFYDRKKLFFKRVDHGVRRRVRPAGRRAQPDHAAPHAPLQHASRARRSTTRRCSASSSDHPRPAASSARRASSPTNAALLERPSSATIDIYDRVLAKMLPTPAKSHYTFNLRDVSRVLQGMLHVEGRQASRSRRS